MQLREFGVSCAEKPAKDLIGAHSDRRKARDPGHHVPPRTVPAIPTATAAEAKRFNELRLPARRPTHPARQLNAVRGVKNHRPSRICHHPQAPHIHDQIVVAERRSALRQHHLSISGGCHFFGGMMDIVRRDKLPLFHIHDSPVRPASSSRSVWRQRNAGIWIMSTTSAARAHLRGFMNVRDDGKTALAQIAQNPQTLPSARVRDIPSGSCGWLCRRKP